jgi:uncharacterized protein YuzE
VELRLETGRNVARLTLDAGAEVARRLTFSDEDHREAWGITLEFDGDGHLVGLEFAEPERQVPERLLVHRRRMWATYDPQVSAAYLYLEDVGRGGVAETLDFGEWGVNLDFDAGGRLVGIEFEDSEVAPAALLAHAELID